MKEICKSSSLVLFHHSLSHVQLFATPWAATRQASLSFTFSMSLLKFMPIESVMPSSHLVLCCPLLLLPSIFPNIRVFSNESALPIRWPKYWSISISPSNKYSGLISLSIDSFDLLAAQGTLKSLLKHYILRASVLQCSAFFFFFFFSGNIFIYLYLFLFLFSFIFVSLRLITLQYCSGFYHTLTCFRNQHWNMYIISLLYDPTLTSIHDYCENHSFD